MTDENNMLVQAIELQGQGRVTEAAELFRKILAANPGDAAALYSLSLIQLNAGQLSEALALSAQGMEVAPRYAPMYLVHGSVLQSMGRREEALRCYDEALAIEPDHLVTLLNSGVLLREMQRHQEALDKFQKVLAIDPDYVAALANSGIIYSEFKQSDQSIPIFERLLKVNPDYRFGQGLLCYEKLHICDWNGVGEMSRNIVDGIRAGKRVCKTLALMAISDNAADHYAAAKLFAPDFFPHKQQPLWRGERYHHDKIRIAYVSPDLREHPVGHLMAGIFERHDKSRFETIAISLGVDDESPLRARMLKAFDRFVDAREMRTDQIAALMREMEVDVAIDLAGYTANSGTGIFTHRPAPVQVNYLGHPGTLGADFMDYILADRHIIPQEQQQYFTEKVVYMPDTYLPTDAGVKISERTPTRAECGLPDEGVVFCSFSHDYKISPPMFDLWMRLLKRVPGSVLWLMSRGDLLQANLRGEAEKRGVDPTRLVFANRVPLIEDHLARYRQADIFLDTHPYNAHTTAADALMAGLPVVTYMGNAFPARVAGSVLHAIGMPELIAHSPEEYEDLAFKLVTTPGLLEDVKGRLKTNKQTQPLFDTDAFCRNLEAVYVAMWRRSQLGDAHDELCGAEG